MEAELRCRLHDAGNPCRVGGRACARSWLDDARLALDRRGGAHPSELALYPPGGYADEQEDQGDRGKRCRSELASAAADTGAAACCEEVLGIAATLVFLWALN